ncbi:MAG: hypothetical protein M3020_01850 [Myxococcota bacterium]|nr:hypothetical protein [Myxococcota bacterium]
MTTFLPEGRATRDPYLRSASLSSAFARWQRKYHPYPIAVPAELRRRVPLPMPLERLTPSLEQTSHDPAHAYMCACCEHTLNKIQHPEAERFKHSRHAHAPRRSTKPRLEHSDHEVDIEYAIDSSITTVSIWSFFVGVSEQQAKTIVEMADPPNWQRAVPAFFEGSDPGTLDEATGKFWLDPELARAPAPNKYQLREYVEWHWSPQVEGGMVNVLEIERPSGEPRPAAAVVEEVLLRTQAEDRYKALLAPKAHGNTPELLDEYDYRLVRSVQSMFVSSWETGGIDVDEGTYAAAFMAPVRERHPGALFVYSKKALRYSQRADIIPGFKTLLNLLAPAVTSMLMTHLGYSGIVNFLRGSPEERTDHAAA